MDIRQFQLPKFSIDTFPTGSKADKNQILSSFNFERLRTSNTQIFLNGRLTIHITHTLLSTSYKPTIWHRPVATAVCE